MTIPDPLPSDLLLDNALERAQKEKRTVSELLFEGIVKLTLSERTYRVELTSFALIGRHRLPPARR